MPERARRIVILGGGFGGAYTAMALERLLRARQDVEVVLVSRENYLVFQPLIPEVVSATIGIVDTIAPLRALCPRTQLYTRDITAVDLGARTVTLAPGVRPRATVLGFDQLVIALGNTTGLQSLRGGAEHALQFKSLGDALHLRNHILHALEEAAIEPDEQLRRELTTFVVAGGGFSGVEVAAQINDFVRHAVKRYPSIDKGELRVVLLHSRDRILPELDEGLALIATRVLSKRGVELRFNCRLSAVTPSEAILVGDERLPSRTVVSTVPSVPNPVVASLGLALVQGRIGVDAHLALPGHDGVWAIGDCAAAKDARTGAGVPPTAQHAIREAQCVARNIVAKIDGRPLTAFHFASFGQLASLGRRSAVAQLFGFRMSGIVAWFLWRTIYLLKLPGLDHKIRVAFAWFLELLFEPDIVQLKTDRTSGIGYEHFEAGDVIIEQGELGDKLYMVKSGTVDVRRSEGGGPAVTVATLGAGDYFGEMALLVDMPRNASVVALTPVDLVVVSRADFHALVGESPVLKRVFQELAIKRAPTPNQHPTPGTQNPAPDSLS